MLFFDTIANRVVFSSRCGRIKIITIYVNEDKKGLGTIWNKKQTELTRYLIDTYKTNMHDSNFHTHTHTHTHTHDVLFVAVYVVVLLPNSVQISGTTESCLVVSKSKLLLSLSFSFSYFVSLFLFLVNCHQQQDQKQTKNYFYLKDEVCN